MSDAKVRHLQIPTHPVIYYNPTISLWTLTFFTHTEKGQPTRRSWHLPTYQQCLDNIINLDRKGGVYRP